MMHEVEVSIMVDEKGFAVASCDPSAIAELYEQDVGDDASVARRTITIKLMVEVSTAVVLEATVPAESSAATLSFV